MTPAARRRRLSPDEARILERFKRLAPQRDALAVALEPFKGDGALDRREWARAFGSDDPQAIVAVTAVTGLFEGLVNHLMEMLHVASRLAGLQLAYGTDKPAAPALIEAVKDDGGLSANQAAVLLRLYRSRNELQHASLDVQADQVREDVLLLQKTLGRFAKSYVEWLERHDIRLLPDRR